MNLQPPPTECHGKTPIQILHEYGTKLGKIPVYILEKEEGEAHQPTFVFNVTIGDVNCKGLCLPTSGTKSVDSWYGRVIIVC